MNNWTPIRSREPSTVHSSSRTLRAEARGVAAHAGNEPEKGRSAIWALARFVDRVQALSDPTRGRSVNVADAYRLPEGTPFRMSRSFDEKSGYRSRSMLVVPMRDHDNLVIGVIQLINKKRNRAAILQPVSLVEDEVVGFAAVDEELAGSLASQAAVAFENADLIRRIRKLFDDFVHAAVSAIEQRDPPTSGHSGRVAKITARRSRRSAASLSCSAGD